MIKKHLLITIFFLLLWFTIFSQVPNQFKYQAVLRDAGGNLMANQAVKIDIVLHQGSTSGTSVFTEQHDVTTTAQGLINLNIGSISDLSIVDFSIDSYFIEISVDNTKMGTSQLLSVPYALHSKSAETADYNNLTNKPTTDGSETKVSAGTNVTITGTGTTENPYIVNATNNTSSNHYVGELFGGGIVYYVDPTGEHGLIMSLHDLQDENGNYEVAWSDSIHASDLGFVFWANDIADGKNNTDKIVAQTTEGAAVLCDKYEINDYNDWYLPSYFELIQIGNEIMTINYELKNDNNTLSTPLNIAPSSYWNSTEELLYSGNVPWCGNIVGGIVRGYESKTRVRAIRKF